MQELIDFMANTIKYSKIIPDFQDIRPRIMCKDGENVSIQAGRMLYSSPREDGLKRYGAVEAGFPSCTPPDSWKGYAEEWKMPTLWETVKALWSGVFGWCGYFKTKGGTSMLHRAWARFTKPIGTQTTYAWIPIEVAYEFIEEHGGIDLGKTFLTEEIADQLVKDFGNEVI